MTTGLIVDLASLSAVADEYVLVEKDGASTGDFTAVPDYRLTLRGEDIAGTRASSAFGASAISSTTDTISITQDTAVPNEVVTWNTSDGGNWNATEKNWIKTGTTTPPITFFHGDIVNFAASGEQVIAINPAGDKTVQAAGMYVSGDGDYVFGGGAITLDGVSGTTLSGADAASGKLVLGGTADENGDVDTSASATFTGSVDLTGAVDSDGVVTLTGTEQNTFKGGVEIYGGALRIANAGQLGTSLSKVSFLTNAADFDASNMKAAIDAYAADPTDATKQAMDEAIADFNNTVSTARDDGALATLLVKNSLTFAGAGEASQRLEIEAGKAGVIHAEAGATVTFANIVHDVTGDAFGGALYVGSGALLALTADGDGAFAFDGNEASGGSGGYGGAIFNDSGTVTLTNASFTRNTAKEGGAIHNYQGTLTLTNASFTGNTADSSGGAIYNYEGTLTLTNASFTANTAVTNFGGAIYNSSSGTVTLTNASFTGNSAYGFGGAIDNNSGRVTLTNASFTGNTAGSSGGAIYNYGNGSISIAVDAGETSLFTGNTDSGGANAIHMQNNSNQTARLTIDNAGVLDMRDPLRGNIIAPDGAIAVTKSGRGEWRLGGANRFTTTNGATTFTVSKGTLRLYRDGEAVNSSTNSGMVETGSLFLSGNGSSFTLGSNASLIAGGGNGISITDGIDSAGSIGIESNTTLGFDIANYTAKDETGATTGLTLTANSLTIATGDTLNFGVNLTSFAGGTYILLDTTEASVLAGINTDNTTVKVGGKDLSRRQTATLTKDASQLLITTTLDHNLDLTWAGGKDGDWGTGENWHKPGDPDDRETFAKGDAVIFTADGGEKNVTVATAVQVAGMTVSGGAYAFTGAAISSTDHTLLPDPTRKLEILGGSAVFHNAIAFAGGIEVGSGAALYGSRTMSGGVNIASGGAFGAAPGESLAVDALTMDAGSTFVVLSEDSLVKVTGRAVVNPETTFDLDALNLREYLYSDSLTILSSDAEITGFQYSVLRDNYALWSLVLANAGDELQVRGEQTHRLTDPVFNLTRNQMAVAQVLESWTSSPLYDAFLLVEDRADINVALDSLSGESYGSTQSLLASFASGFWEVRNGLPDVLREEYAATVTSGSGYASFARDCGRRGPLLWFQGGGMTERSSRGSDVARGKHYGSEFSVGGEMDFGSWALGLAFRYADTRLKVDDRHSRSDLDNYQLGLYAIKGFRLGCGQLRTTFGLAGGYHDIEARRNAWIGNAFQERLRSDYHAWSLDALAEAEYRLEFSSVHSLAPYAAANWDSVWTKSFREHGGSAALTGDAEHQGNLSTTLGLRYGARLGKRVRADLDLGWRHTYGNLRPSAGLRFAGDPSRNSFTAIGAALARDEFVLGAGLAVDLTDRVFLRLDYDLNAGDRTLGHRGTVSIGVGF